MSNVKQTPAEKPLAHPAPEAPVTPAGLKPIRRIASKEGFWTGGATVKSFQVKQTGEERQTPNESSSRFVESLEWHPLGVRVVLLERSGVRRAMIFTSDKIDRIDEA